MVRRNLHGTQAFSWYAGMGHFTPLILSTSGEMGPDCAVFVKLLAKKIAQKKNQEQANVMRILRTEL